MSGPYNLDMVTERLQDDESMIYNDSMLEECREIVLRNYKFLKSKEEEMGCVVDEII
jgi:hypothetical protein